MDGRHRIGYTGGDGYDCRGLADAQWLTVLFAAAERQLSQALNAGRGESTFGAIRKRGSGGKEYPH